MPENNVDVAEVTKYLELVKELVGIGADVLPEGKFKDKFVTVKQFLDKPTATEVVVVGFKAYEDVKELVLELSK